MNVQALPLDAIYAEPGWNSRGQILPQDVLELARSIQQDGLQQPIVVRPCQDLPGKSYRIVAGFSRFAAYQYLGRSHIDCVIRDDLSEREAKRVNIIENVMRKNLNMKQEAGAVQQLRALGLTPEAIAKELGQSRFWVDVRLRLLQLPEVVQEEAAAGLLTAEQIMQVTRLKTPKKQLEALQWLKEQRAAGNKRRLDLLTRKAHRTVKSRKQMLRIKDLLAYHVGTEHLAWKVIAWAVGELADIEKHIKKS